MTLDKLITDYASYVSLIDATEDLDKINMTLSQFCILCKRVDYTSNSDLLTAFNTISAELSSRGVTVQYDPVGTSAPTS